MTRNARFIDERITLKYGTGGGAMRALIEQIFAKGLGEVERWHRPPALWTTGRRFASATSTS